MKPPALRWYDLCGAPWLLVRLPVVIAALVALVAAMSFGGYYYPDTTAYLEHTFFTGLQTGFNDRPPVYSLLLDLLLYLAPSGARMFLLVLVQQACGVAIVYMIQRIGVVSGHWLAGWFAAALTVCTPILWMYAQGAQSEILYVFLAVLACLLFLRGLVERRTLPTFLGGLVCALAIGCRTPGVAIAGAVLVATWWSRETQRVRVTLRFCAGLALGIGSLVGLNKVHYGSATLVNGTGMHMFDRVALLERSAPDTDEVRLLKVLNAANGKNKESIFHQYAGWNLYFLLKKAGYTSKQADQLLAKAAIQAMTEHPFRSVGLTLQSMRESTASRFRILWYLFTGTLAPEEFDEFCESSIKKWGGDPEHFKRIQSNLPPYPPQLALGRWPIGLVREWDNLDWMWRGTWVLVAAAMACALGMVVRSAPLIVLSFVGLGQLLLVAIGEEPCSRYWDSSVAIFQATLILSVAELGRRVHRRWRRRGSAAAPASMSGVPVGLAQQS